LKYQLFETAYLQQLGYIFKNKTNQMTCFDSKTYYFGA